MCAIIGTVNHELNRLCLSKLYSRGPDYNSLYKNKNVSFAHARLSVIDAEGGNQPMHSMSGNSTIIFNGEIYNARELDASHKSDTRVLLEYYEKHGIEKTLQDINGMFSFAILDKEQNKIFIARDRLGVKPLFYYNKNNKLIFCSEINPIKDEVGISNLSINSTALGVYFRLFFIPSPITIWNEIQSLKQGSYLTYDLKSNQLQQKTYWKLSEPERSETNINRLEELIENASTIRTRSDVPYSVFLSGGIDSTLITKYLSTFNQNLQTYTVEVQDPNLNEAEYSSIAAAKFKTKHSSIKLKYKNILINHLREMTTHFGQPFADLSIIPYDLISKQIGSRSIVALGGDGADESFCGYDRYNNPTGTVEDLYRNKQFNLIPSEDPRDFMLNNLPYIPTDKSELLRILDINYFLEGDILQKVDRLSMRHSLEVRSPLLDYRIVEFSNTLDYNLMFKMRKKEALRRLLEKDFSKDFIDRKKIGLTLTPENLKATVDSYLDQYSFSHSLVCPNWLKKVTSNYYLKFAMLMFVLWHEENYV